MQTIKRDIYVTKNVLQAPIEVTEGTNSIAIEFDVRDYDIPASAAAVAYSLSTSSMEEPNKALADVSGNKITIIPSETFFLPGQNVMQIRIIDGNSKLISFNIIVKCTGKMRFGDEDEKGQSTLIEQILAKLGEYKGELDVERKRIDNLAKIPFVTPEMYGAIGDGKTDDTIAINNAFNSNLPVVGSGNYKFSNIEIKKNAIFNGNLIGNITIKLPYINLFFNNLYGTLTLTSEISFTQKISVYGNTIYSDNVGLYMNGEKGIQYCNINIKNIRGQKCLLMEVNNSNGWCNNNYFNFINFGDDKGTPTAITASTTLSSYTDIFNYNIFNGCSIEGDVFIKWLNLKFCKQFTFINCRFSPYEAKSDDSENYNNRGEAINCPTLTFINMFDGFAVDRLNFINSSAKIIGGTISKTGVDIGNNTLYSHNSKVTKYLRPQLFIKTDETIPQVIDAHKYDVNDEIVIDFVTTKYVSIILNFTEIFEYTKYIKIRILTAPTSAYNVSIRGNNKTVNIMDFNMYKTSGIYYFNIQSILE